MSTDLDCQDPAAFIAACRARGITRVAMAVQQEWAQDPDRSEVDYRRLARIHLLAYQGGTLVRCVVGEADPVEVGRQLAESGLTVERRSRNLT